MGKLRAVEKSSHFIVNKDKNKSIPSFVIFDLRDESVVYWKNHFAKKKKKSQNFFSHNFFLCPENFFYTSSKFSRQDGKTKFSRQDGKTRWGLKIVTRL